MAFLSIYSWALILAIIILMIFIFRSLYYRLKIKISAINNNRSYREELKHSTIESKKKQDNEQILQEYSDSENQKTIEYLKKLRNEDK